MDQLLLSAKEQKQLYIPAGFAHGFLALTDTVQFLYKCTSAVITMPRPTSTPFFGTIRLSLSSGCFASSAFTERRQESETRRRPTAISAAILASMKSTILLTGKTGQLGSELNRLLPRLGEVIAPERSELDLRDPETIQQVMRSTNARLVVNAAAYTAVDATETDQANASAVNAEAPRLLSLAAKKIGAMLVHFSTDYVFDGSKKSLR
jgi:hypothetical protein